MQLRDIQKGTLIALAIVIASCTISMMVIFIGGSAGGGDMQTLLVVQSAAIAPAILIVFADIVARARRAKRGENSYSLWAALPAWLLLALLLPNLLVVIGELSLFLRQYLTDTAIQWYEHAPLISTLVCSIALCVVYARLYPATRDTNQNVGRW